MSDDSLGETTHSVFVSSTPREMFLAAQGWRDAPIYFGRIVSGTPSTIVRCLLQPPPLVAPPVRVVPQPVDRAVVPRAEVAADAAPALARRRVRAKNVGAVDLPVRERRGEHHATARNDVSNARARVGDPARVDGLVRPELEVLEERPAAGGRPRREREGALIATATNAPIATNVPSARRGVLTVTTVMIATYVARDPQQLDAPVVRGSAPSALSAPSEVADPSAVTHVREVANAATHARATHARFVATLGPGRDPRPVPPRAILEADASTTAPVRIVPVVDPCRPVRVAIPAHARGALHVN
jgi:hypothetical protein